MNFARTRKQKCKKPRKLDCGFYADKGDTVVVTVGYYEAEFHHYEECERCHVQAYHGYEFEGHAHGDLVQT